MSAEKQKAPAKPNTPPAPKPEVTRDNLTAENLSYFTPQSIEDEQAAYEIANPPFKIVDNRAWEWKREVPGLSSRSKEMRTIFSPDEFDNFTPSTNPTRDELQMMYRHELHDQIKPLIPKDAKYTVGEGHDGLKKKELKDFITYEINSLNRDITESDLRQLSPDTIVEHYAALRNAGIDNKALIKNVDFTRSTEELKQLHDELIASGVDPADLELIRQGIALNEQPLKPASVSSEPSSETATEGDAPQPSPKQPDDIPELREKALDQLDSLLEDQEHIDTLVKLLWPDKVVENLYKFLAAGAKIDLNKLVSDTPIGVVSSDPLTFIKAGASANVVLERMNGKSLLKNYDTLRSVGVDEAKLKDRLALFQLSPEDRAEWQARQSQSPNENIASTPEVEHQATKQAAEQQREEPLTLAEKFGYAAVQNVLKNK